MEMEISGANKEGAGLAWSGAFSVGFMFQNNKGNPRSESTPDARYAVVRILCCKVKQP
ncbi:MAG: hypothetical protein JXR25_08320 [Pontiellaceae bacterium]|nr:hypothetical protein [Pontiellaceae bacterium]MBN2784818.1 hypothetical protein [Pontiellaceae bacterium]